MEKKRIYTNYEINEFLDYEKNELKLLEKWKN